MSSTRHLVSIPLGDNTLSVDCWHTSGRKSNIYYEPDYPEEIEIERIMIGQEDVTELLATLYVQQGHKMTPMKYVSVWEVLEDKCLEKIYDQR